MAIQRNSTTLETLEKISHFFGVSVGVFFGEKDIFNSIRKSFERLDDDVQKAYNYIVTTLLFYKGTKWTSENQSNEMYLTIDGGTDAPGYFTKK